MTGLLRFTGRHLSSDLVLVTLSNERVMRRLTGIVVMTILMKNML